MCALNVRTAQAVTSEGHMTIAIHQQPRAMSAPPRAGSGFIVGGGLLLALGVLAGTLPPFTSAASPLVIGCMLLLSGLVGFVALVASRAQTHPLWRIVFAMAAIIAGAIVLWGPLAGALTIVFVVAADLVVGSVACGLRRDSGSHCPTGKRPCIT
jgi:uncharacterized membrane protein HdeD (DUF308 family)